MGIKLDAVKGINIKGKLLIKMKNGEVLPLKEKKLKAMLASSVVYAQTSRQSLPIYLLVG